MHVVTSESGMNSVPIAERFAQISVSISVGIFQVPEVGNHGEYDSIAQRQHARRRPRFQRMESVGKDR